MFETQKIVEIEASALHARVEEMKDAGYRLMQISCTKLFDHLQLDYTFDKDYQFYGLRFKLSDDRPTLKSVSDIYLAAFLYENELHDLFGIEIEDMAIDFKGKFYRIEKKAPFAANIDIVTEKD